MAVQVIVAIVSIDVLSAVRAYVTGESLYSKGQKDAQIHLLAYADSHDEADYRQFVQALTAPLGDRAAREALQLPQPDRARAWQGLLAGETHPDDIPGVIRLFLWLQDVPFMARPIRTWTEGDGVIEQIRALVEQAHERIAAGDTKAVEVRELRARAQVLNQRMSQLEREFSAQLGDASRLAKRLLFVVNLGLALLLATTGLWFIRYSLRRQALVEDEVRRRQQSLQRLLDSTAEGLYGVDNQGRCTFINRAALAMLGCQREAELLGRDIHGLILRARPVAGAAPAPASLAHAEGRELHVTGESFLRRDGSSFAVECWSHPVLQDGVAEGAVVTFFDVSERLRMQAALREGELRLAKLVDAVADGVITTGAHDRILLFNRAAERLFGVPASEAIGSHIRRFIPQSPRATPAPEPGHAGANGAGSGLVHELTGTRANGETFPLEATLSHLSTDHGPLTTVVLRDVTELHAARAERQAREALEAASRAKTEFLSRMSHELRTPLNAVLGFSQLLRLDTGSPPSAQQLDRIRHIERAGSHLLALVNDVLDLSRVESGQMSMSLEPVDLVSVVEESIAMVSTQAIDAGVRVERAVLAADLVAGGDVQVVADRVRLRQVLVNLLNNAVKYNRAHGTVTVGWALHGETCHVGVIDDGPGMSPEQTARLFEPFNRLGAEKTSIEGTGIGLFLSRRLVELMGGELMITSRLGRGTVATLVLECSDEQAYAPPLPSAPSQHGEFDAGLNVLYAEDNEVNVELVRQVVSFRPSIALQVAGNGTQALQMARRNPPDLMLVDMHLGDMSGMDLARALRRDPATAGIRLVALSADALPEQIDGALALGFEAYLTKPIEFRKLLRVLDGHLQT
ncbi:hybrid sensor histidine kinase/response regulator [Ideonella sp.]|uniref:hybrid sensor histidine kinase/response regulator n=1 Tax=Ideonella sp. TaxID=1929293 RepID=UPI002B489296|nr:ATP-binding protein [Ideonella sp.]HJV71576.1 ATP-binding protein [Ideonella sp.]